MRKYAGRANVREKVDIAARLIVRAERLTVIPCRIVDRSEGGMKVELAVSWPLPGKVFLIGDESEDLYECELRWQNEETAGLMLIDICVHSMRKAILAKLESAVILMPPAEDLPLEGQEAERGPATLCAPLSDPCKGE